MITAQKVVVLDTEFDDSRIAGRVALFNEDGTPFTGGGGGESSPVSWADVTNKPAVIAAGADQAAARAAIGAGTSSLVVGTGANQAKAGDYTPAWGDVTGKPTTFAPATHNQAASTISVTEAGSLTGATAQLALEALAARIAALEAAAA